MEVCNHRPALRRRKRRFPDQSPRSLAYRASANRPALHSADHREDRARSRYPGPGPRYRRAGRPGRACHLQRALGARSERLRRLPRQPVPQRRQSRRHAQSAFGVSRRRREDRSCEGRQRFIPGRGGWDPCWPASGTRPPPPTSCAFLERSSSQEISGNLGDSTGRPPLRPCRNSSGEALGGAVRAAAMPCDSSRGLRSAKRGADHGWSRAARA